MAQAKVYDSANGSISEEEVDVSSLGDGTKRKLMRSAVIRYQANLRHGNHSTMTRGEGNRSGRKPFRQKGTGNARAGDFNSPVWTGGATIFGPKPRSYRTQMTVKARRVALRSAILGKFQDGEALFVRGLSMEVPSTRTAAKLLADLGVDTGAVVVLEADSGAIYRSFRNLPRVDIVPAAELNAYHVLKRRHLVFFGDAFAAVESRWSRKEAAADG